jgi:hypothetical protein
MHCLEAGVAGYRLPLKATVHSKGTDGFEAGQALNSTPDALVVRNRARSFTQLARSMLNTKSGSACAGHGVG